MKHATIPPLPGDTAGPYRLLAGLGVGGMASVYRAEGPYGLVALKILHPNRVTTEELKRFQREYLTLKRLDHPHVVRVFDTGSEHGHPWLAMELVEGTDLGTLLERWEQDSPPDRFEQVEKILKGLCEALAYVHEQGIVHRDLKPGNVLITKEGVAKLSDFGVVKDTDHFTTNLTMVGRLIGTVAFMAPEQITGEPVDARADLYSLGALLYNMLTLKRPIQADSIAGYLARHLSESPRPPSELEPRTPSHLERVCLKLLEKEPSRRYSSARQVLVALSADPPALTPLHGRQEALDQLLDRLSSLTSLGVGGLVTILGPSGSGRTRILQELHERAREQGAQSIFIDSTFNFEGLLVALPAVEEPRGAGTLARIRARMGQNPWVILVDDLDLAKASLVEGLTKLVRDVVAVEGGPLLLVASALPESLQRPSPTQAPTLAYGLLSGVETGLTTAEVVLGGLDRDAVRALLRDQGLVGGVGAALGRRLQEELGGLPGAVMEQVDTLLQTGWLVRGTDGTLRPTRSLEAFRGEPLPLPDRVRALEGRFLDALPRLQRVCLEALAVLRGPSASAASRPLLSALIDVPDATLREALGELVRKGLVEEQEEALEELYLLPSARRAQVVLESMKPETRVALHRQAAASLQQMYRRRVGAIAEIAAWHLVQGGDPVGAYPLLIQGAARALRRNDTAAAKLLCQRALEARPAAEAAMSPVDAARWRRQLFTTQGDALRVSDRVEAAGDAYAQALLAARTEGDPLAQGRALAGVGLVALARGRLPEATGALEQAVGALPRGEQIWPEVATGLAALRFQQGDAGAMARLVRQVSELGEEGGRSATLDSLWGEFLLRRASGDDAGARALVNGLEVAPTDPRTAEAWVRILRQRAELALLAGETTQVVELSDAIEELAERFVLSSGPLALSLRLSALWQMGERGPALRLAQELPEVLKVGRCRNLGVWAPVVRVLSSQQEGWDLAALFQDPGWPPDPPFDTETLRLSLLALSQRAQGDAWESARIVLRRPPGLVPAATARAQVDVARVLARTSDRDMAVRALEMALERLDRRLHRALVNEACQLGEEIAPGRGWR